MNLGKGIYGSGNFCESGEKGRDVIIRNYGHRNSGSEMTSATRELTTLQRSGIVLLENSNIHFTGASDISGEYANTSMRFGIFEVDLNLFMANASGIVLGEVGSPVYMDSIHDVRSLYLNGTAYSDINIVSSSLSNNWQPVGIKESDNKLYRIDITTDPDNPAVVGDALESSEENVIRFNGDSRLWVRYKNKTTGKLMYGPLIGFFRMRADAFTPRGTESFAYARPKLTANNNTLQDYPTVTGEGVPTGNTWNAGDGGFLSYNSSYNDFITTSDGDPLIVLGFTYPSRANGNDGGNAFTNTRQYPYYNLEKMTRGNTDLDTEQYREWALPTIAGNIWYVDGRGIGNGGWGKDGLHSAHWGDYPDKPKKTFTGKYGIFNDLTTGTYPDNYPFNAKDDIVFVVGPVVANSEVSDALNQTMLNGDPTKHYPLKLFRYPGGHQMSNHQIDGGGGTAPTDPDYNGVTSGTAGPGVNKGAMILANVGDTRTFVLDNVEVDGLYTYTDDEKTIYKIPDAYATQKLEVSEPLVLTTSDSKLIIKGNTAQGGTVLKRGYNKTNVLGSYDDGSGNMVPNFGLNPDFNLTTVHNGAGMYVHPAATVNVEGLVTITDNVQKANDLTPTPSNVYLPTFSKYLNITGALDGSTKIGVMNPIRNTASHYTYNTFSPVAMGVREGYDNGPGGSGVAWDTIDAKNAWENSNFLDDAQNIAQFFVNEYTNDDPRSMYYAQTIIDYPSESSYPDPGKTLFLGWTWANVVRTQPDGFFVDNDPDKDVVIDSKEDLVWLISKVNGINNMTASTFAGKKVTQTVDIDLSEYVWVPVGSSSAAPFSGQYNGQGHTISGLYIEYLGKGSRHYEYNDFGLFGVVTNGTLDLTFLTGGEINPIGAANIGGLAGLLQTVGNGTRAAVKNSEAAISIRVPDKGTTALGTFYAGGLVGEANNADIHSSIAVPDITVSGAFDYIGGLVGGTTGISTATTTNVLNSYANSHFNLGNNIAGAGGLVGHAAYLDLKNCYVHLYSVGDLNDTPKSFGRLVYNGSNSTLTNTFAFKLADVGITGQSYEFVKEPAGITTSTCFEYNAVADADSYRYLCNDNLVIDGELSKPLTKCLNDYIEHETPNVLGGNKAYARWARAGVPEVNGDLPVLLWGNYDGDGNIGQGQLSCLGSYDGISLQVGGTLRDPVNPIGNLAAHIDPEGQDPINPNGGKGNRSGGTLYIYGDQPDPIIFGTTPDKVVICEDAAILQPGDLATFDNTYVGVTFDNSSRSAVDAYGHPLGRDWHMFSTPLSNAPLGMDYVVGGVDENNPANNKVYTPSASAWTDPSLLDAGLPIYPFTEASSLNGDGYFPSSPTASSTDYGYQYDFYTWYEPDWQWINFKRNGPSHWHYDEVPNDPDHEHKPIEYHAHFGIDPDDPSDDAPANQNESTLVPGKGYMMAIQDNTFLQSHGRLNDGNLDFTITNSVGTQTWSWMPGSMGYYGNNFVGNPYHAYLDFGDGTTGFGYDNGFNSYYIYDADIPGGAKSETGGGYRIYAAGGSRGGYYAPRYLHPHQGFFLQWAVEPNPIYKTITFKPSQLKNRHDADNSDFRDWRPNYPLVNLFAYDNEGRGDVVVIEFNRPENGGGKKVKTLRNGNHLIYAHNGDTDYGAFFAVEGTSRVPVRFMSLESEQKPYTLRWNTQNGFFNSLYLIDNLLGITYDMLANDSYTFVGSKEDYVSRFVIVFNVTDVEENTDPKTFAFYDGSSWVVNGTGRLEVIDVTGRILYTEDLHNEQNHVNLNRYAKGVYVLRLWKHDKASIQKIVKY